MIIRGDRLTAQQERQVFAAYIYRHHAIGAGKYYPTERAWLVDHA